MPELTEEDKLEFAENVIVLGFDRAITYLDKETDPILSEYIKKIH